MQQALYFRGAALAGDLVAQLGLVICTAFWSFEEPFSHDDIFKVRNFDKTSQRQTKKKNYTQSTLTPQKLSMHPEAFHRFIGNKAKCSSYSL